MTLLYGATLSGAILKKCIRGHVAPPIKNYMAKVMLKFCWLLDNILNSFREVPKMRQTAEILDDKLMEFTLDLKKKVGTPKKLVKDL